MEKITGTTSSGFEYSYDGRILSDWGYISLLRKVVGDNVERTDKLAATVDIFTMLLGEEQTERLVEHIRESNDGFAPVNVLVEEFKEIIEPKN